MSARRNKSTSPHLPAPFLRSVHTIPDRIDAGEFPFTMPLFSSGIDLEFTTAITFLVGENGSGKSTLIEALAARADSTPKAAAGISVSARMPTHTESHNFAAGPPRLFAELTRRIFLRAESFFNVATY